MEYPNMRYGFLSEKERDFPAMVVLKITNVCNLECIHCPYKIISKYKDYKPRYMEWKLYEKIVREVARYEGVVFRLLCDGEPLMHPRFLEMIMLAKENKISPVNFITNGVLLNEQLAKAIIDIGVEVVEISLDAFSKETYESIRKGSNYELVMNNVHKFIEIRNKKGANTKIMVSIIVQPESEKELEIFKRYWEGRADRVITRVYTSIGGLVDRSKLRISNEGDRWPCPQLWRRIFINHDGLAEFCVEDWNDETAIGDVNDEDIQEIWQSKEYQKIRESHLSKNFDKVSYCSRCIDWKAREWGYDYFYAINKILTNK